ncbi:hypothetical protein EDC04DRAFT_1860156 [Pisolithus marmoratus]|nr:hypothetical protein EDC04DRAFT_1860156 [Pisolithus marmoratus]
MGHQSFLCRKLDNLPPWSLVHSRTTQANLIMLALHPIQKTLGSDPRVDMPEKKSNGGDGVVAGDGRVSNTSPSNPTLLDAEAWNELLQKFRDDVAELQNQEGSPSAQSETAKKLVSVKKSRRSIASSTAISSSKHTPAQPTGLGLTEAPSLPNHHGSISTAHARSESPSNDSSCPVCLQKPFHVLHNCPIVLKGPDVIQQRLDELRHSDVRDSQEFIGELEALIRQHKDSETVTTAHNLLPDEASCETNTHSLAVASSPSQSLTLHDLPGDSHFTDAVGSSDEESSVESSDENGGRIAQTIYPPKPSVTRGSMSYGDDMLEAVVRGPASRRVLTDILKELQEEEETQDSHFRLAMKMGNIRCHPLLLRMGTGVHIASLLIRHPPLELRVDNRASTVRTHERPQGELIPTAARRWCRLGIIQNSTMMQTHLGLDWIRTSQGSTLSSLTCLLPGRWTSLTL